VRREFIKLENIAVILIALLLLTLFWINFSQTGCWVIGSKRESGIHSLCGSGGFIAGIITTFVFVIASYYWLKGKD